MTGGKHWLFSFMKEPFLFVESIKNSSDYHPLFRVEQNTSKNWGKTYSGLSKTQARTGAKQLCEDREGNDKVPVWPLARYLNQCCRLSNYIFRAQ